MWHPTSMVLPVYLESSARRAADARASVMWPAIPFEQQFWFTINDTVGYPEHCLSETKRKLLLSKSVYNLVKNSNFLELNDPKLLGWYFSLPAGYKKLIQEEGGLAQFLHQHPALEVNRHIVHLKQHVLGNCQTYPAPDLPAKLDGSQRATFYDMLQCANCGASCQSGATKCRSCSTLLLISGENVCISEDERTLQLLPNSVREELNLMNAKGHVSANMSMRSSRQFNSIQKTSNNLSATRRNPLNRFQQTEHPRMSSSGGQPLYNMWKERVPCDMQDIRLFKDSSTQASFSLDWELEMQAQNQSSNYEPVSLLPHTMSDVPTSEKEMTEFYSFNSITTEHTPAQMNKIMDTSMEVTKSSFVAASADGGADNGAFPDSASILSNSSEWTDITDDCQNLSNEDEVEGEMKTEEFHSMIAEEVSNSTDYIPCITPSCSECSQCTKEGESTYESCISSASLNELTVKATTRCEVSPFSPSVSQAVDVSNEFRACFTATRATEITQDFFVKHCQDVSIDSDSCRVNQWTQTVYTPTSDKNTVTDVYMSDLDAVCEEFGKLQMIEEELMHLKEEMSRSGLNTEGEPNLEQQSVHCGCGAIPRAKWAELRLLALQFAMCQQHCWRHFYTSPQAETSLQRIEALPVAMSQTLKVLEDNYLKMKRKILKGVPLDDLKPLYVDTKRLTSVTCYKPSLIYEAFLGYSQPEHSFKPSAQDEDRTNEPDEVWKMNITDGRHLNRNLSASQRQQLSDPETLLKTASSSRSSDVPASIQQPGVSSDASLYINNSDAWFDAKEEIRYDSQSCKEDKQTERRDQEDSNREHKVNACGMKSQCFLLCVSNLPNNITEQDLLLWFAKYHTLQVSKFNNAGVAILSVRNSNDLEAAVREMDGQSIQGHTLNVKHIQESPADHQATCKESQIQLSLDARKPRLAGKELITPASNNNVSRPLHCSMDMLTSICSTPTSSGTCVPQHYGTMGSFDTIMAQLSVRHPQMGRKKIINSLLKLQAKHHGVLSGLPLRDIVDMASELLTHSTTD